MNVHDEEASVNFVDRREEIMAERSAASTWKTKRRQQDKCCSNARHSSFSSNRPCLDLWHLFTLILTQAMMKVVFIVRARTKGVPQEVLAVKTSQISIPKKLEAFLMTGSLYSLPLQSRKMQAVMPMETLQKRTNIKSKAGLGCRTGANYGPVSWHIVRMALYCKLFDSWTSYLFYNSAYFPCFEHRPCKTVKLAANYAV